MDFYKNRDKSEEAELFIRHLFSLPCAKYFAAYYKISSRAIEMVCGLF